MLGLKLLFRVIIKQLDHILSNINDLILGFINNIFFKTFGFYPEISPIYIYLTLLVAFVILGVFLGYIQGKAEKLEIQFMGNDLVSKVIRYILLLLYISTTTTILYWVVRLIL